jgi:hypothetical protein
MRPAVVLAWAGVLLAAAPAVAVDWSGFAAFEARAFLDGEGEAGQAAGTLSLVLQPELYHDWDDGDQSFRFTPFLRLDQRDGERTHADLRELYWQKVARRWELLVGVRKLFWGVTESVHLVDVINQTDLVEDPDGEQKLGQPMVQLKLFPGLGTLDLFLLAGFRERTFPGAEGRLRPEPPVDPDLAAYESSAGQERLDWALRWSLIAGPFDLGLSHFSGTGRDPLLQPAVDDAGEPALRPFYELVDQTGLDLQATLGPWLWKLEAIHRRSRSQRFTAAVGGFEYTFFDLRRTGVDLGVLVEYLDDGRREQPETLFAGSRLTFNDVQGTDLLLGGAVSLEDGSTFLNLEGSRRLGSAWRLSVRARAFAGVSASSPLAPLRRDDYLQLRLSRFF